MRYGLLVFLGLILLGMASVAVLLPRATASPVALPTVFVLPSLTSSTTPTHSATPTSTPTATVTSTATLTHTPTMTASPTFTPTLSTRVLEIRAVMPGVYVPPTPTPFPFGTILLPAPPQPVEPLPDATNQPPPYNGWYSFESDNPAVQYSAPWSPRLHANASRGQYHRSENTTSFVSFPFEGEGLRIRYVAARNMGLFDVIVDGVVIDTIDAYAPELHFPATEVYFVGRGAHTLTLRSSQQKNSASEGYAIGLDAVQVFRGTANTLIIPPPAESATPTQLPMPAAGIELINAPPTARPTTTPIAPGQLSVSIIIAYDENGNRAVDPSEGVLGIPVRVVAVGTNRVIAQGFTDRSGFVQLTVVNSGAARVVVPYFGKVWQLPANRRGGQAAFTLLLAPANQPGLIP